jgi:hypothetical protein
MFVKVIKTDIDNESTKYKLELFLSLYDIIIKESEIGLCLAIKAYDDLYYNKEVYIYVKEYNPRIRSICESILSKDVYISDDKYALPRVDISINDDISDYAIYYGKVDGLYNYKIDNAFIKTSNDMDMMSIF